MTFNNFTVANNRPLTLIAGPCQIESLDHSLYMAERLTKITQKLGINFIYKSSFDKANRTSAETPRGVGLEEGLSILAEVKKQIGCNLLTDVHKEEQCEIVSEIVDVLQIPAFLCRQTDLLKAAAATHKIINVKKGQFLSPWDMKAVYEKLKYFKAKEIWLTERGTCFGYNNLVSDMRSLAIMAELGPAVIFDATHSVQQPGGLGTSSGGQRKYVTILARAAVASTPIAGIFMEVHDDPNNAPSDGPCMLYLDSIDQILQQLIAYDRIIKNY